MGNILQEGNFSCSHPFNVSTILVPARVTGWSASQELAVLLREESILNTAPASCRDCTRIGFIQSPSVLDNSSGRA